MRVTVLCICVALLGCGGGEREVATAPADRNLVARVSFTATVRSIGYLSRFEGTMIPVDFDPGFALALNVKEVSPENGTIKAGSRVVFGIHSPTRLFGALIRIDDFLRDPVGKTFDFTVERRKDQRGVYWSMLAAEKLRQ